MTGLLPYVVVALAGGAWSLLAMRVLWSRPLWLSCPFILAVTTLLGRHLFHLMTQT